MDEFPQDYPCMGGWMNSPSANRVFLWLCSHRGLALAMGGGGQWPTDPIPHPRP